MGIDLHREKVKAWMENNKDDYMDECEDAADCVQYLVEDANYECDTSLDTDDLEKIAKEVLGIED